MDRKILKYAISVLNTQNKHCNDYVKKYGRMHPDTLQQQAYTKGIKDAIEILADRYLSMDTDGKYKFVPIER